MISSLRLQNFRSFKDNTFEVSQGVNIVMGPNASGKTNLLEAVLVIARGSSYRAKDAELIRFNQSWARLGAEAPDGSKRTIKIASPPNPAKTYEIGANTYKRLTYNHHLPVVLFEPEHLRLLSGGPERRRDYLDDLLEQTDPAYAAVRRKYRRALSQRNTLLKQAAKPHEQIFPWNLRLSELGGQIVRARAEISEQLNNEISGVYKKLAGPKTATSVKYLNKWPVDSYESKLLKELENAIELDRARGFTAAGPHREDLAVLFDGRPATDVASRGEVRTAVLALKIIELKLLEKIRGTTPLLLLDDVFSELDGRRRHALTDYLAPYQTFITTTDADSVLGHFTESANIIPLGTLAG